MMTDAEIAEIAAAWGYGSGSATYIINRLLDELKAARADAQLLTEKFDNLQELYYHARAERDAARIAATIRRFAERRTDAPDGSRTATSSANAEDRSQSSTPEAK